MLTIKSTDCISELFLDEDAHITYVPVKKAKNKPKSVQLAILKPYANLEIGKLYLISTVNHDGLETGFTIVKILGESDKQKDHVVGVNKFTNKVAIYPKSETVVYGAKGSGFKGRDKTFNYVEIEDIDNLLSVK